jgi:hypothetical protein
MGIVERAAAVSELTVRRWLHLPLSLQALPKRRRRHANRGACGKNSSNYNKLKNQRNFTHFRDGKIYLLSIRAFLNESA